jgi:L-asparaginase
VGTGGTISSEASHSLDYEYDDRDGGILQTDHLVERVPELRREFDVTPINFRSVPSSALTPEDWLNLARRIQDVLEAQPEIDGLVVTHGTATLEETAFFLHLVIKTDRPVVLVGAQRPLNALSTDGPLNLLNACRVASSRDASGLGVLVVVNNEIHSAREATKTSNHRADAFGSPTIGALGHVDVNGDVVIYRRPTRRGVSESEFDIRKVTGLPRVDIAYSYAGSDGTAIDAFVAAGAQAVVVAALAPGNPTPGEVRAAHTARRKAVLIIQSTRASSGRVVPRPRLARQGFIVADNLSPQKARILTMVALTKTDDAAELARMFSEY